MSAADRAPGWGRRVHDLGSLKVEGAAACLTRAGHQRAGVDRALGTGPSSATNSCVALDTDHRLRSHMNTGLLGSGNLETRGEGVLGNCSGKAAPTSKCRLKSIQNGGAFWRKRSQPERWRGGGGSSEGLGPLPSADQVAVACWPEIPSSVTEQVLDPLSLALLGGSGSIFSGSPGDAFPTEANSKPGLSLLSQRS